MDRNVISHDSVYITINHRLGNFHAKNNSRKKFCVDKFLRLVRSAKFFNG